MSSLLSQLFRSLVIRPSAFGGVLLAFGFAGNLAANGDKASPSQLRELLDEVETLRFSGEHEQGLEIAGKVLRTAREQDLPDVEIEATYEIALLCYFQEDYERARAHLEVGYNEAKRLDLERLQADCLGALGVLEWKLGNLSLAQARLTDTLALFADLKEPTCMASTANNLGIISFTLKHYPEAIDWYIRGLSFLGEEQEDRLRASLLSNLAEVLIPSGRLDEAEGYLDQALAIELELNDPRNLAYTYYNFGELRSRQNDSEQALELYLRALHMQEQIEDLWASSLTRIRLAEEYWKTGRVDSALAELTRGMESARKLNALALLRDFSDQFAEIYASTGEEGLASYYRELSDWFSSRTQKAQGIAEETSLSSRSNGIQEEPHPDRIQGPLQSSVQTAAILILFVMIGLLAVENMRLRKRARQS